MCHAFPASLIDTDTEVLVVQTTAEAHCKVATAWLLPHVLSQCKLISPKDVVLQISSESVLLFPGTNSTLLETLHPPPKCIVVLDGTWDSAKRLSKNSAVLASLPRVHLSPMETPPLFRVRRPPAHIPDARSTAEAVADAVEALKGKNAIAAAQAVRRAVNEASEMQLRFLRQNNTGNVPHRTDKPGYVPGLYDDRNRNTKE